MELLTTVDDFTRSHPLFSGGVVFAFVIWICLKQFVFKRSGIANYSGLVAALDLFLIPLAIMCIGGLLHLGLQSSGFSKINTQLQVVVHLLVIMSVAWCLARFVELYLLSRTKRDDIANYLPGLQRGMLFGLALFLAFVLFSNIKGFAITGLYLSTGAAAAVVAFAMQRTLGDLFSGIALSVEHPFRIGDWIELTNGSQGQVVDINWRATRLRTWDNATLVVPNSALAQEGIKNMHGSDHAFAPWYEVKIVADVDPRFAKALLLEAALRCERVLKEPLPSVRLVDASTIPYTYMVWVHFENFLSMFAGREELFREIHYSLKDAGIQVAPDIREMHTRDVEVMKIEAPTTLLALKGLDIASAFNDKELEQMASMSQRHTFDDGTVLIREGDVAGAFDIIVTGIVEASITTGTGSSKNVDQLKAGQYFGITSMVIDNPSFLQFAAKTEVTLIRVDLECFRKILNQRPDLSEELAKVVKQRLDASQEMKLSTSKPASWFTIQDILKRIDTLRH